MVRITSVGKGRKLAPLAPRVLGMAMLAAAVLVAVACSGGNAQQKTTQTPAGTAVAKITPAPNVNAGLKTPITFSPGDYLTAADLAARGTGVPGRGPFDGVRLLIPSIGVDAPFSDKVVPASGVMPNPNSWDDVAYYDFSQFPGLGGLPGKGGNIVIAGHVDYIHHGPAVFWRLHELKPGDIVTIRMKDGSELNYKIEFNKVLDPGSADWTALVQATADESVTLITCTGVFENGHYNNRQVAWGRRV